LGVGVSVCIAAIADQLHPRILCVVDRKASSIEFSNEDAGIPKLEPVTPHWCAMLAGNDISPGVPIIRSVKRKLGNNRVSLETIMSAFEESYQQRLSSLAASLVLGRWKLTMKQFLDTGRKRFGDDNFDAMWSQIQTIKLQCRFLVSGFDDDRRPHIFVVKNPGCAEVMDSIGYFAIGNGDVAAMSILGFLKQNIGCVLSLTCANVWSAKFMAEGATDVGKPSFGVLYDADGFDCNHPYEEIEAVVRAGWEEETGRPFVSVKTGRAVESLLEKAREKNSAMRSVAQKSTGQQ
jgi:hypothetical protein